MKSFTIKNARLWLLPTFTEWLLPLVPKKLPLCPAYVPHILKCKMTDQEILSEWDIEPYTPAELFALLNHLIGTPPRGQKGELLANGYSNLFYVRLEGRVVAVNVYWHSDDREWYLSVYDLDDDRWHDGACVFSRSVTSQLLNILDLNGKVMELDGKRYRFVREK